MKLLKAMCNLDVAIIITYGFLKLNLLKMYDVYMMQKIGEKISQEKK